MTSDLALTETVFATDMKGYRRRCLLATRLDLTLPAWQRSIDFSALSGDDHAFGGLDFIGCNFAEMPADRATSSTSDI